MRLWGVFCKRATIGCEPEIPEDRILAETCDLCHQVVQTDHSIRWQHTWNRSSNRFDDSKEYGLSG
jgi:hypothetical protein